MSQPAALAPTARRISQVTERDMAISFVLELAELGDFSVSLLGFYDDDADFLAALASRLEVANDQAYQRKLKRVARRLVSFGVLHSKMRGTNKEYLGEPAKTQIYWLRAGKAGLLTRGKTDATMEPAKEAAFLLRHAYPPPERDP